MISTIDVVTINVADQDRSLAFFVDRLGFRKVADNELGPGWRWVEVAPPGGGARLSLAKGEAPSSLVFGADSVAATYADLSAKGVAFTQAPEAQPWGMTTARFVDLDGNGFTLVGPA